ncbi:hypothetical protein VTN49DRAFT_2585 [Thermomyces lanuginosus]|uniref:uncharacterized protein n=1 Tax=Thermomyces lanuginosus TaxID=5541 RepID=UPI00374349DE
MDKSSQCTTTAQSTRKSPLRRKESVATQISEEFNGVQAVETVGPPWFEMGWPRFTDQEPWSRSAAIDSESGHRSDSRDDPRTLNRSGEQWGVLEGGER